MFVLLAGTLRLEVFWSIAKEIVIVTMIARWVWFASSVRTERMYQGVFSMEPMKRRTKLVIYASTHEKSVRLISSTKTRKSWRAGFEE